LTLFPVLSQISLALTTVENRSTALINRHRLNRLFCVISFIHPDTIRRGRGGAQDLIAPRY
jgi:hypothetical protein